MLLFAHLLSTIMCQKHTHSLNDITQRHMISVSHNMSLCITHMTRKKKVTKFAKKLSLATSFCMSLVQQDMGLACKYIKYNSVSTNSHIYRVIHKSLWDFWPLRYSSRDGHAEGEHVNRGRETPSFCPTLHVLDMSTLGDVADVNPVMKFLPHTVNHVA
jgi:hypothetical protein